MHLAARPHTCFFLVRCTHEIHSPVYSFFALVACFLLVTFDCAVCPVVPSPHRLLRSSPSQQTLFYAPQRNGLHPNKYGMLARALTAPEHIINLTGCVYVVHISRSNDIRPTTTTMRKSARVLTFFFWSVVVIRHLRFVGIAHPLGESRVGRAVRGIIIQRKKVKRPSDISASWPPYFERMVFILVPLLYRSSTRRQGRNANIHSFIRFSRIGVISSSLSVSSAHWLA